MITCIIFIYAEYLHVLALVSNAFIFGKCAYTLGYAGKISVEVASLRLHTLQSRKTDHACTKTEISKLEHSRTQELSYLCTVSPLANVNELALKMTLNLCVAPSCISTFQNNVSNKLNIFKIVLHGQTSFLA